MQFQVNKYLHNDFSNFSAGDARVFHHHGADLCDPSQIAEMFQFIQDKFSRGPDILINNAGSPPSTPPAVEIVCVSHTHSHDRAGMQYVGPIESFPADKWDQVLAVNLSASFHTIKLALPGMRERGMTVCGSNYHIGMHTFGYACKNLKMFFSIMLQGVCCLLRLGEDSEYLFSARTGWVGS